MDTIEAYHLARSLMREHGLQGYNVYPNWTFEFDRSKRRFGYCSYARKCISLSEYLTRLNGYNEVRNTILHEIAHALAYLKYGDCGHDYRWVAIAKSIGCDGNRCYSAAAVVTPAHTYLGKCANFDECGFTTGRDRKSTKMFRLEHTNCRMKNKPAKIEWYEGSRRIYS